jgi:pyruvate kinase
LGPNSMDRQVISDLATAGVTGFRVNLSHTSIEHLEEILEFIQRCTSVPVCLDTEGAQLRTGDLGRGFTVQVGERVRLVPDALAGESSAIPITPGEALGRIEASSRMSIDFDSVFLRVDRVADGAADATVLSGGQIGSHKAVTAFPSPPLPSFSSKDRAAIRIGMQHGVREYALSFCEQAAAVHQLREIIGPERTIIAKIESREGVRNLGKIAEFADALLIDRGDLSREVRLEASPLLQKAIIRKAKALGTPVYVATNLLESMVGKRAPTRAEVNDVMNTLLDGADGLVLAAETAVGQYPVEAARMIMALIKEYEGSLEGYRIDDLLGDHPLSIDRNLRALPRGAPGPKEFHPQASVPVPPGTAAGWMSEPLERSSPPRRPLPTPTQEASVS